jgi:hypothetical protein
MKRIYLSCLLVLAAASCAAQTKAKALEELKESVEGYNEAYRWKNYERASAFIPQDLRAAFLATYEEDDNSLHIEDFEVLAVNLDGEKAATVKVRVRYMLLPSVNVERRTVTQHWHKVDGTWIMETEDDPIRPIATGSSPKNPEAFGPAEPDAEHKGDTKVQATNPRGETVRKDQGMEDEARPEDR